MTPFEAYKDNLLGTSWLGSVVDINDPDKIGRIKVRVFGKFDSLQISDIPWAMPAQTVSGSNMFSVPKLDSIVGIQFNNGDLYYPEYRFLQNFSDDVKSLLKESYENSHVLVYDSETEGKFKLYFNESDGFMVDYKQVKINVKPNKDVLVENPGGYSILLQNNGELKIDAKKVTVKCENAKIDASKKIHLNCSKNSSIKLGANATQSLVLGEQFMLMFNTHTHTGNLSYPTGPPNSPMTNSQLSKIVKTQ